MSADEKYDTLIGNFADTRRRLVKAIDDHLQSARRVVAERELFAPEVVSQAREAVRTLTQLFLDMTK